MKIFIYLIIINISSVCFCQENAIIRHENRQNFATDTLQFGSFFIIDYGDGDSLGVESPLATFKNRLDTARNSEHAPNIPIIYKTTVTLTATQVFNNTWVPIIPAQASGKMALVDKAYLFYDYGTITYIANEITIELSYDAGTTAHVTFPPENAAGLLSSTSNKVALLFAQGSTIDPTNNAIYIRNNTSMTPPTGDGILTITLWYSIIDI